MVDLNAYILEKIRTWVWSGFYSTEQVNLFIGDLLDDESDEAMLRNSVRPEFRKKLAAERTWPTTTDCDRLDDTFLELNEAGIIALQNTGMTMSDGQDDVGQALTDRGRDGWAGYCFYHGQDLERAISGRGLWIAFGDLDAIDSQRIEVGRRVKASLQRVGFEVESNDDPDKRLVIPKFDWKRREVR